MRKMKRKPTSPGEMLNEEFLKPMDMTQRKFAAAFSMSVEFWLNLQMSLDIWNLAKSHPSLSKPLILKSRAG
jgi:plasmid maintenance system antidote protein VapI